MTLSKDRQEIADLDIREKCNRIRYVYSTATGHLGKISRSTASKAEINELLLQNYEQCLQVISNNIVMVYQGLFHGNAPPTDEDISSIVEVISRTLTENILFSDFDPYPVLRDNPWKAQIDRIKERAELELKVAAKRMTILFNERQVVTVKDPAKVFVVHGRNLKARDAMFTFLDSIDVKPLEWSQAKKATGKPSPHISEILDTAFNLARAVVVLFTPDDVAYLRRELGEERTNTYQARPNVLFEAGLAMGRDPSRVVLVELGEVRPFTDIGGIHVIKMDDSVEKRQDLADCLLNAKCPVDITGRRWHKAGDFDQALEGL